GALPIWDGGLVENDQNPENYSEPEKNAAGAFADECAVVTDRTQTGQGRNAKQERQEAGEDAVGDVDDYGSVGAAERAVADDGGEADKARHICDQSKCKQDEGNRDKAADRCIDGIMAGFDPLFDAFGLEEPDEEEDGPQKFRGKDQPSGIWLGDKDLANAVDEIKDHESVEDRIERADDKTA